MRIEIKTPTFPESIEEGTVAKWHKKEGDTLEQDENLVDIETDKVVLEVPAPKRGKLISIQKPIGSAVKAKEVLAVIDTEMEKGEGKMEKEKMASGEMIQKLISPAVRRLIEQHHLSITDLQKEGRITKEDVLAAVKKKTTLTPAPLAVKPQETQSDLRPQKRVPMTRLRARIAERLVNAQHNAAILTTFNEVNLQAIKKLREDHRESFEKTHGIKLGWMSFFVKATLEALKRFPEVNASIDSQDIVYHGFYDIGVAVSTPRGLVVPIVRNADLMTLADIERTIDDYAKRAKDGKLSLEEMTGGTFTITNGGVFGSLFATPILNPPQTAILGMHKIQERPIAEKGEIVIRPMMYLALSYDHRLIDGREAVSFVVTIKEVLEEPSRLLLEI
ncbi:MAG: 2-oxoglutarate dehydrogenase complex dihydrolipoyllysine-residue succinyltransferase [Gammaproteobacteria bacterium]|nr:2-oxoglutarate dehydrogenase complex dihydrolipoyllysine-residue succinyltransferase [Gammaproteobacteria bacterium]